MEYHDQPLQFISNHFFQVKSKGDAKYKIIVRIIKALTYLPLTLMPFISCLTITYICPLISCYVNQYSEANEKDEFFQIPGQTDMHLMQTKITKKWKTLHLVCLFLTSFVVNMNLLELHIYSAVKLIEYGNEILHEEEFLFGPSGYHYLPYMHAKLSYFLVGTLLILAIGYSIIYVYKHKKSVFIATSISVNVIYILCYFFPTMLLAFLHDPLLTIFSCFMAIAGIGIIYAMIWSFGLSLLTNIVTTLIPWPHTWLSLKVLIYSSIVSTAAYSIFHLLVLIDNVIELGSFSDFQALQNDMLLPVLMGLLSLLIVKPAYKYASKYANIKKVVKDEERNNIISDHQVDKACITIDQAEDSHNNVIQEMDGQNDENIIV